MASAKDSRSRARHVRVVLRGNEEQAAAPDLVAHALDDNGDVVVSAPLDAERRFDAQDQAFSRAARVLIGPAEVDPGERRRFYVVGGQRWRRIVETGEMTIPAPRWRNWFPFRRCVEGNVRHCLPIVGVLDSLLVQSGMAKLSLADEVLGRRAVLVRPPRCKPICFGTIEVYRRVCCCKRVLPELEPPYELIPDFPWPPEWVEPLPPIPPIGPTPDPPPFELQRLLLTDGTFDARKVALARLREVSLLSDAARRDLLATYGWLWCDCEKVEKVADGIVEDGGSFSVCWLAPISVLPAGCREEYAYVVKQTLGGTDVTIYNGVAANQWFEAGEEPTLTSYHGSAVACRSSDVPGTGAFVALEDIGTTESYSLASPPQTSATSVGPVAYNSGLLNPAPTADDALGLPLNRNLGGDVRLVYQFSEPMKAEGARFYRVLVARATDAGTPTGAWSVLPAPVWEAKRPDGSGMLIPLAAEVGGQSLCWIPYDAGPPLGVGEEWQAYNAHAVIPTAAFPDGRYLVAVEVFNAAGDRLKPATADASEPGTTAGFAFKRWTGFGTTVDVPFAALTHMMWWDNRRAYAAIEDIRLDGVASNQQCQFLEGGAGAKVAVGYRAYHPQPGQPSFLLNHSLTIRRGLNGPTWPVANTSEKEVGEGTPSGHPSLALTLNTMLGDEPSGAQRCAFAVTLTARVKTTNGASSLDLGAQVTAAFAAAIGS